MNEIYIVFKGDEPVSRIIKVFTDKDKANLFVERFNEINSAEYAPKARVEAHEISEEVEDLVPYLSLYRFFSNSGENDQREEIEGVMWKSHAFDSHGWAGRGLTGWVVTAEGCDFDKVRKTFDEKKRYVKSQIEGNG